jgi:hypothetical protein
MKLVNKFGDKMAENINELLSLCNADALHRDNLTELSTKRSAVGYMTRHLNVSEFDVAQRAVWYKIADEARMECGPSYRPDKESVEAEEVFGDRFVHKANYLINYSGTNPDKSYEYLQTSDLVKLKTKRGVMRYILETLDFLKFNDYHKKLWRYIVDEANRTPFTYENPNGIFVDGIRVDTTRIFTDDVEKIYRIIRNSSHERIDELLIRADVRINSAKWRIETVDDHHHIDVYSPGGTSTYWVSSESDDKTERHYGMTYIPNLLWCYTTLYDEAVARLVKKFGRFYGPKK